MGIQRRPQYSRHDKVASPAWLHWLWKGAYMLIDARLSVMSCPFSALTLLVGQQEWPLQNILPRLTRVPPRP